MDADAQLDVESILARLGLDAEAALAMVESALHEANKPSDWKAYRPSPKHIEFIETGTAYAIRSLIAGNQQGKTLVACFELSCHLMNQYPGWWTGRRYSHGVRVWACGETGESVQKTLQKYLVGEDGSGKGGLLDPSLITNVILSSGGGGQIETVEIKTIHGGTSRLSFRSYAQGRKRFQGDTLHIAYCDEEAPLDIYTEIMTRLNVHRGMLLTTFTPLEKFGSVYKLLTETPPPGSVIVKMTIDDAVHLSEEARAEIKARYTNESDRMARLYGVPGTSSGRVFPVDREDIICQPFRIPNYYRCIGGMDFGWDHPSAAVCLAHDPDSGVIYVCREFRARHNTPLQVAAAVRPWGDWLPWAWPHDGHASGGKFDQADQKQLHVIYRDHGLKMLPTHATFKDGGNGVEAGLQMMLELMQSGLFKVFDTCYQYLDEVNGYYRDDGKLIKLDDDLISASRYAFMMLRYAKIKSNNDNDFHLPPLPTYTRLTGPMG